MNSRLKWIVLIPAAALLCANAPYAFGQVAKDLREDGSEVTVENTDFGAFGREDEAKPEDEAEPEATGDDSDSSEAEDSSDAEDSEDPEDSEESEDAEDESEDDEDFGEDE